MSERQVKDKWRAAIERGDYLTIFYKGQVWRMPDPLKVWDFPPKFLDDSRD